MIECVLQLLFEICEDKRVKSDKKNIYDHRPKEYKQFTIVRKLYD